MSLLISTFEGLTDEDFDNYLPKRWSNNLHNLGRMKAKERVLTLAKALVARVGGDGLTVEASSEIPSVWNGRQVRDQWAYLLRDADARRTMAPVVASRLDLATRVKDPAEHHRHALICVHLDHERLEVGLRINHLASIDLANLLGRSEAEPEALTATLSALPEDITLDGAPVNAARLKRAAQNVRAGELEWLVVARSIEREAAVELGDGIMEVVEAAADALAPLFRFILWHPENDHIGFESEIEAFNEAVEARKKADQEAKAAQDKQRASREEKARARTSSRVDAEEAWRKLQAEKRRRIEKQRAAEAARLAEIAAAKRAEKAAEEAAKAAQVAAEAPVEAEEAPAEAAPEAPAAAPEEAPAAREDKPARKPRARSGDRPSGDRGPRKGARGPRPERGARRGKPGAGKPTGKPGGKGATGKGGPRAKASRGPQRPAHTFAAGDRARLTRGLFAGKEGVVKGPGKAGYYKVKVGPLEVAVGAHELEPMK